MLRFSSNEPVRVRILGPDIIQTVDTPRVFAHFDSTVTDLVPDPDSIYLWRPDGSLTKLCWKCKSAPAGMSGPCPYAVEIGGDDSPCDCCGCMAQSCRDDI